MSEQPLPGNEVTGLVMVLSNKDLQDQILAQFATPRDFARLSQVSKEFRAFIDLSKMYNTLELTKFTVAQKLSETIDDTKNGIANRVKYLIIGEFEASPRDKPLHFLKTFIGKLNALESLTVAYGSKYKGLDLAGASLPALMHYDGPCSLLADVLVAAPKLRSVRLDGALWTSSTPENWCFNLWGDARRKGDFAHALTCLRASTSVRDLKFGVMAASFSDMYGVLDTKAPLLTALESLTIVWTTTPRLDAGVASMTALGDKWLSHMPALHTLLFYVPGDFNFVDGDDAKGVLEKWRKGCPQLAKVALGKAAVWDYANGSWVRVVAK